MEIPIWIKRALDEKGIAQIEEAVTQAEAHTTAEIVPMVVRSSIVTGHVSWLLFFITIPIAWMVMPLALHSAIGDVLTIVVAGICAVGLKDLAFVQRWLTPAKDEAISVMRRAQLEFHTSAIRATEKHTGVLILVSLLERKAVVLADSAVAEKFDPHAWDAVLAALLEQIKKGDFAGGMKEAIHLVGKMLAEKFPAPSHDTNELPNALVIKE